MCCLPCPALQERVVTRTRDASGRDHVEEHVRPAPGHQRLEQQQRGAQALPPPGSHQRAADFGGGGSLGWGGGGRYV